MSGKAVLVTLLAFCFYEKGLGADEVFRCPDPFRPEEVNTLTYQVNTTAIKEAKCELPTRRLTFSVNRNDSFDTICNIAYECPSPGPVTDPTPGKVTCGCVSKSADVWTFEVKLYVEKKKDTGARFGFNVCSGADKPPTQDIQKSCSSISIREDDDGGLGTTTIVIIAVVVIVVVVAAVVIGVVVMRKRGFGGMPVRT